MTEKEQGIVQQEQEVKQMEQNIATLQKDNETLFATNKEKTSQLKDFRTLITQLEAALNQKNTEIRHLKAQLSDPAINETHSIADTSLHTPTANRANFSIEGDRRPSDEYEVTRSIPDLANRKIARPGMHSSTPGNL